MASFITPATSRPGEMELLIQLLEKQKDRKIKILPDGAVRCDEPRSITLTINGQPSNLKLYTLYFDPDPSPTQVWLTEDLHFSRWPICGSPWSPKAMRHRAIRFNLLSRRRRASRTMGPS